MSRSRHGFRLGWLRCEIEVRAREIGLELVLSRHVEERVDRVGDSGMTRIVGDLHLDVRPAICAWRESNETVAVDDGLRHGAPRDHDVRHVLRHLCIPRQQFSRRRHHLPVGAAVLVVGHTMK